MGPGGGGAAFSAGVSNLGNTMGQTGLTGTQLVLAGIGNLTLSQLTDLNGGTISISGGTAGAGFSLGVSGGNTAGDTGITGTRVALAGGNGITLSQATDVNGGTVTISGITQSVQTQDRFDLSLDGNTAGVLALVSSGTLTLAGGNNVTLSQNGNAITISGANTVAQTAQTGISSIAASNATYTSGQVEFTGSGIVTIRSSAGQRVVIDASVAPQSVQTQNLHNVTLSGNTAGVMAQISSGTLTLAGGNNITLSQNGNAVTISGAAAGGAQTFVAGLAASNTTYTSGTITITGVGGGVTVSSNTGQRIDISVAAPVAQTNQAGSLFAVGNSTSSSSGTYDARTLSLRGDGIISIAATNSGFRISATQSNQAGSLFAVGNTTSSSSGTFDARSMSIRGDGIISVAATNSGWRISATESVQTQNLHNVTLSGNTAGVMAQVSSGTMTLAGGNNITLSQAGNAITISGANVGGAQTGISGIIASDATYTSGTVEFTGSGIVTIRSSAGQRVVVDASQSVQSLGAYALGNTTGQSSSTTLDARTISIRGDGIVSVGYSNGSLRISASQSVQPETQTAISGIANSQTTYTSGTVSMSELGAITIRSTTGNQFQFSVNAQTVQTQNMVAVTLSGNTSGAQALISSGTMTLAGGNNITVSQNGNAVTISGPNVGGAQTGISGIANSQTTYTSGSVTLSELGAITIRSTTGNHFQFSVNPQSVQPETQTFVGGLANSQTTYTSGTISMSELGAITIRSTTGNQFQFSVNAQSVQTQGQMSAGVSTGGNTAGDTGVTGTRLVFVGSNNITLSQATAAAGGTITISGPTTAAQTNQAGSVFAVGNTTSSSSGTYDARTLSIRGDGIISVAATNSGWRISATESVQTQNLHNVTLSGNTAGAMAQISSGTMTLAGGNNITLSQAGNAVTISGPTTVAQSVQPGVQHFVVSNTTFSSGTVSISGFGDVTVNTAANLIRISAPVQTAQTGISGIANSQTTYTSGTVSLSELGAITIRSTTGNQYQFSVNSQTLQTSNVHNVTLSGNTAGAMAQISSGTMTLAGGNGITLSQAGNAVTISGGGGGAFSAGVSTGGNTQGNTGVTGTRLVFVGTNNITLSQNTDANGGTISISGQSPAGGAFSGGASNLGNTAGATGISGTQMVLVGSGVMSLSQTTGANGNTVSILAPAASVISAVAPLSTSTAGSTISILGPATSSMVGVGNITVSTDGSTISIGDTATPINFWDNMVPGASTTFQLSEAGMQIFPLNPANAGFPGYMSVSSVFFDMSGTVSTAAAFTRSLSFGIFTLVNSTQLSRLYSASTSWGTNAGNMNINDSMGGRRWVTLHSSQFNSPPNFHQGSDYFMAVWHRSSSGSQTFAFQGQLLPYATGLRSGFMSVGSATNTTNAHYPFLGVYSVSFSTAMPASLAASDINKSVATAISLPRVVFNNIGSNIL